MRSTEIKGAALLTIALALAACSSSKQMQPGSAMSSPAPAMSQPSAMSQSPAPGSTSARTGTFEGLNDKHVAGTAAVSDGQIVLSGFSSDAGPDLHIYLASGSDENAVAAGKQISSVAFDKPSQTFSTTGVDASKYTTVVIHCDKAKAVFGAASLT
jgi:ABC-type oligopeptide transport system substrate-binding subunit